MAFVLDPNGPAMEPPDGQVSDFDNRGSHSREDVALLIIFAILATLLVLFRVWSRLMMKPRIFGIEEGLLICALVSNSSLQQADKLQENGLTVHLSGYLFRLSLHVLLYCYLPWHLCPPMEH